MKAKSAVKTRHASFGVRLRLRGGLVAIDRGREGARVALDNAVGKVPDARSVLFGQFRVVRHHDYQAVAGDFGERDP